MSRGNVKWSGPEGVLAHAATIVHSYDTGVTLRQLFYRLVSDQTLPNTRTYYQSLSRYTAEGRRNNTFPELLDRSTRVEEPQAHDSVTAGMGWLHQTYRRPRLETQPWQIFLGVEKDGMSEQLDAWFTQPFSIPYVALGGYASQAICTQVAKRIGSDSRPSVLIYAGDHDPTGEDIDRDFQARVGFDEVIRVALTSEQLDEYDVPVNELDPEVTAKLQRDSRSNAFVNRHGYLDQYELDALDPPDLRALYQQAIDQFFDWSEFYEMVEREANDRAILEYLHKWVRTYEEEEE